MTVFTTLPRAVRAFAVGLLMVAALTATAGCVHSITIQQGNFLEPKDVDRVAVGMTRIQVRALLGTPMVADPFETHRWDYIYYLKTSRLKKPIYRQFTVYFEEDKVVRVDRSDAEPAKSAEAGAESAVENRG